MLRGDEARESAILMTAAWADRSLGGGRGPRRPHNHTSCPRRSYLREPSASHRRSHLPTWVGDVGLREWRVGAVDRPPRGSVHRSSLQVACDRTNPGGMSMAASSNAAGRSELLPRQRRSPSSSWHHTGTSHRLPVHRGVPGPPLGRSATCAWAGWRVLGSRAATHTAASSTGCPDVGASFLLRTNEIEICRP